MQGTPLRRSRGSRSEISLMASPPPGSPDYLSSVSPDESLKLIQSYCQSLKAANNLSLSHTLTTHTHTLIHISWEASNCLLLCMDLTKSDSTLHKNLRGPRNVTHRLEISSGLHMSSQMIFFNVSFREGNGNPLQYSCLENPMDGGACQNEKNCCGRQIGVRIPPGGRKAWL